MRAVKISDEQVRNIRTRVAQGAARKDLAVYYGVTLETIGRIVRGESRISPAETKVEPFKREVSETEIQAGAQRMLELQEELRRGGRMQELHPAREESGPPAAPVLGATEGTLSSEKVRWLLGQE